MSVALPIELPAEIRETILALELPEDWDGEGADPVSRETCEAALTFLADALRRRGDLLMPRPAASPLGAVSLYWRNGDRHLTIRVSGDTPDEVFIQENGPADYRWNGREARDEALIRLATFFSSS